MATPTMVGNWDAGTLIDGRFQLITLLRHTGSAVVWRARDVVHNSQITVVQHPRPRTTDAQMSRRREAQMASSIVADCWVRVLGFGEWDGRSYLVADSVQGESVEDVIRNAQARGQSLRPDVVVAIARSVLAALELTSKAGMVHGDVSTGAVYCNGNGSAQLLCIGLARAQDPMLSAPLPHMSPEQVRGELIDYSADLWSLGILMYRMLCGSYPFLPSAVTTLRDAILQKPLPDLGASGVPRELTAVIARALDRDPLRRYSSAHQMRAALLAVGSSSACTHPPVSSVVGSSSNYTVSPPSTPRGMPPAGSHGPIESHGPMASVRPVADSTLGGSVWSGPCGLPPTTPRSSANALARPYSDAPGSARAVHTQRSINTPRGGGGGGGDGGGTLASRADAMPHNGSLDTESSRGGREREYNGQSSGGTSMMPTPASLVSQTRGIYTWNQASASSGLAAGGITSRGQQSMTPRVAESLASGRRIEARGERGEGGELPGSVGLVVTRDAPHEVLEVADLLDPNGVMQGEPGYSNPVILAGDRLVAIDGVEVEMMPIANVHALLRGPSGTKLRIDVVRGRQPLSIVALRHLPHRGADLATPRLPDPPPRNIPPAVSTPRIAADRQRLLQPVDALDTDTDNGRDSRQDPSDSSCRGPVWMAAAVPGRAGGGRTVRVDQKGLDDGVDNFRSLAVAVAVCAPGAHVLVAAGTYQEEIVLQQSVHVRAEDNARVLVSGQAGRALVVCCASNVHISGISVSQTGGDGSLRGRETVRAVEVFDGSLTMSKCTLWSERGIGVMVAERGAVVLKQCVLQGNGKCGALATDGGKLTCEGSEVQANRMYGIVCQNGGKAVVTCNNICKNSAVGVLVHRPGAECTLTGNEISDNGEMGIAVQDGAQVKMEKNRAARNKHAALYADGPKAWASVWKTEFIDSGVRGIGVQGGGCVEALECIVAGNLQEGVFVSGRNSRGLLQGNEITNNGSKGVGVQSAGFVLIKGNRITSNKEGGVFACDPDTLITVKDNTVSRNGMRGIGVQLGATAEIENNAIEGNGAEGVYVSRHVYSLSLPLSLSLSLSIYLSIYLSLTHAHTRVAAGFAGSHRQEQGSRQWCQGHRSTVWSRCLVGGQYYPRQ
jgi:parallel beta-helix repeat protein